MNTAALGTWRNPPLAYVVAELVVSPYYSMGNAIPGLQDKLRNTYPRTVEAQELLIENNKPSTQPLWRLLSGDQKHGVQLGTRAVSLHATSYLHSGDFLTRWSEILDAIATAKLGAFVERVGLRYVDIIVPAEERAPADYLEERLQGVTPEGAAVTGSMWAAGFLYDGCVVNLRTAAPAPKGLLLPPDFNALPLNKPRVMLEAEARVKDDKPIGFIDTDCVKEIQRVFSAAELVDVYTGMQKLTSRAFKAVLSPVGKEKWI